MQIVGVDFGTSNVRIATWDTDAPDHLPEPRAIGPVDTFAMPAVIAFLRRQDGTIETVVGEEADSLQDSSDIVVARNIKRWALAGDPFVQWHLESANTQWPEWWNRQTRCIRLWGDELPVKKAIGRILAESFRRAGLRGEFEWRAGCPVHAGLEYRSELAEVLSEFGSNNDVTSVIEEPILFLALAHRRETLPTGSYLVYDLGGGSFDCSLAEVEENGEMTVYASHGHPLLGGVRLDELLTAQVGYKGPPHLLRIAKEQLTRSDPNVAVDAHTRLSWNDLEDVVDEDKFLDETVKAMREAYISAKVIWKREEGASPVLNIPSLRWEDVPDAFQNNLDAILLTGGPTKSPLFREKLADCFGDQKVKSAAELLPAEISDPELTALSMGACYAATGAYNPLCISRLPARITLRETGTHNQVEYKPYEHFVSNFNPARPFVSKALRPERGVDAKYELTISDPDGSRLLRKTVDVNLRKVGKPTERFRQSPLPGERMPANTEMYPRLLIDKLGRIWIYNNGRFWAEVETAPWQTPRQRAALNSILQKQREYEEEKRGQVHALITQNPFGWQSGHA